MIFWALLEKKGISLICFGLFFFWIINTDFTFFYKKTTIFFIMISRQTFPSAGFLVWINNIWETFLFQTLWCNGTIILRILRYLLSHYFVKMLQIFETLRSIILSHFWWHIRLRWWRTTAFRLHGLAECLATLSIAIQRGDKTDLFFQVNKRAYKKPLMMTLPFYSKTETGIWQQLFHCTWTLNFTLIQSKKAKTKSSHSSLALKKQTKANSALQCCASATSQAINHLSVGGVGYLSVFVCLFSCKFFLCSG